MTIKQLGGVFGRNPTFNDVTIEGTLTFDGAIDITSDLTIEDNLYVLGSVGIGTSNASAKLTVDLGTTGTIAHFEGDASDALNIDGDSNGISLDARNVGHLGFEMQGTEAMRITSSRNLLVGGTSTLTSARIESFGPSNGVAGIGMRHTGATTGQWWRIYMQNDSKAIFANAAGTGVSLTYGGTSWAAVSDERLKENISDIGPVLDKVTNYRCVNYSLKATQSADANKIGFIAQDWEADFPNVVDRDENDELSMRYTETIPVLLKAIQEQQDLIESLTARVAQLEGAN